MKQKPITIGIWLLTITAIIITVIVTSNAIDYFQTLDKLKQHVNHNPNHHGHNLHETYTTIVTVASYSAFLIFLLITIMIGVSIYAPRRYQERPLKAVALIGAIFISTVFSVSVIAPYDPEVTVLLYAIVISASIIGGVGSLPFFTYYYDEPSNKQAYTNERIHDFHRTQATILVLWCIFVPFIGFTTAPGATAKLEAELTHNHASQAQNTTHERTEHNEQRPLISVRR